MKMKSPTEEMEDVSALLTMRSRVDSSKPADEMTVEEKLGEMQDMARRLGRRDFVGNELQTHDSVKHAIVKRVSELVGRPVPLTQIALKWKDLLREVAMKEFTDGESGHPDQHIARALN